MFNSLKDAQAWIESVYRFSDKYDLSRMQQASAMLGNPENHFKSIHVGGTNGKGSTVTFLKNILIEAGYNVGTYTSPYVVRFNERISYNNQDIDDDTLLEYINTIYQLHQDYLKKYNDQVSFFELVTLISFLYFKDKQPDIAIIEVGLGGTLDATNIITPLISVITTIGTDHMHVLGPTIEDVAKNKLGIVKDNVPLVSGHTQRFLDPLFIAETTRHHSPYYHTKDTPLENVELGIPTTFTFLNSVYKLTMAGIHQVDNAHTSLLTCKVLESTYDFVIPDRAKQEGLLKAFWPGRFEVFGNVIIDGAHNKEGLESAIKTVEHYYPNKRIKSLFTVMKDKDYTPMLRMLENIADEITFTEISHPRCEKADVLKAKSIHQHVHANPNPIDALIENMPKDDSEILLVTGSLYFISEIRQHLNREKP
ncbi:MAG: bifunctional folylpolyglutamate synthase/dihydrofolate synthase [Bacillota bacterium]